MPTEDYRKIAFEVYDRECQKCGMVNADHIETFSSGIPVHHIDGDRTNNDISNLLPLCHDCHWSVHAGDRGFESLHERIKFEENTDEKDCRINIKTATETRDRLREVKREGETWDGVLRRAADALDYDETLDADEIRHIVRDELDRALSEYVNTY